MQSRSIGIVVIVTALTVMACASDTSRTSGSDPSASTSSIVESGAASTTAVDEPPPATSATATPSTSTTTTSVAPTTTERVTTTAVPTTTIPSHRADCAAPLPPPALLNGDPPGVGLDGPDNSVIWGSGENAVTEYVEPDLEDKFTTIEDLVKLAEHAGNIRVAGEATAAVVPVGDGSAGLIQMILLDAAFGCERQYSIGPGVTVDDALDFAQTFVEALQ